MMGDIKADMSWRLVPKLAMAGTFLMEVCLGWKFLGIIIRYLKNKPTGEQQLIDIYHRITFESLRIQGPIVFVYMLLEYAFMDTGDIMAKIWMWPTYSISSVAALTFGSNPLMQLILADVSNEQISISDRWIYWLANLSLWVPMIIAISVCTPLEIYPPGYYLMRGQAVKYPAFQITFLISVVIIVLTLVTRQCFKKQNSHSFFDRHPIKLKAIALSSILYPIYIIFNMQEYLSVLLGLIFFVIFPLIIISANEKLFESTNIKHPRLGEMIKKFKQNVFKDVQPAPTTPGDPESIEMGQLSQKTLSKFQGGQEQEPNPMFKENPRSPPCMENMNKNIKKKRINRGRSRNPTETKSKSKRIIPPSPSKLIAPPPSPAHGPKAELKGADLNLEPNVIVVEYK